jgi:hypothetical protein
MISGKPGANIEEADVLRRMLAEVELRLNPTVGSHHHDRYIR